MLWHFLKFKSSLILCHIIIAFAWATSHYLPYFMTFMSVFENRTSAQSCWLRRWWNWGTCRWGWCKLKLFKLMLQAQYMEQKGEQNLRPRDLWWAKSPSKKKKKTILDRNMILVSGPSQGRTQRSGALVLWRQRLSLHWHCWEFGANQLDLTSTSK